MSAPKSFPLRWQRELVTLRSFSADYKRTIPTFKREIFAWAPRHRHGNAQAGSRPEIWHQSGLSTLRNLQREHGQQTLNRHLSYHGRHHREAQSIGLRDLFLQGLEAQTNFSHLLCAPATLRRRRKPSSQLLVWYVLLAYEHEQRKSKWSDPVPISFCTYDSLLSVLGLALRQKKWASLSTLKTTTVIQ